MQIGSFAAVRIADAKSSWTSRHVFERFLRPLGEVLVGLSTNAVQRYNPAHGPVSIAERLPTRDGAITRTGAFPEKARICKPLECHAEQAKTFMKGLSDRLENSGCEFFLAEEHIKPGSEWEDTIKAKLRCSDAFVVLCSKNTLDRYWIGLEIGAAWVLGKPIYPVRLEGGPETYPEPLAGRQVYNARRQDSAEQTGAVLHFLDSLAAELAKPPYSHSGGELVNRINASLNDVKKDFRRVRERQPTQKITVHGHETVELTQTYLELTNEGNKRQLGNAWELLWRKYELVSGMWDREQNWSDGEAEMAELDWKLTQLFPEMRFHCVIREDLAQSNPELRPFIGKFVEFIVRE